MASAHVIEEELPDRPAKRARTLLNADAVGLRNGHTYGNTTINTSNMVIMGDHFQHSGHGYQDDPTTTKEEIYETLVRSLSFDRIAFRVNNVKSALTSTCEWLFRHPHFRTWYECSASDKYNGFLWIKGKPGCGKSTIMKAALEWARKRKVKDRARQTIVPYFFNARASTSLEKSGLGLYRTIVHHLLSSHPPLKTLFMNKFASKTPGQLGEEWTSEELQGLLEDIVESDESFKLYLFIDALDEAEHEDDVRQMISFLIQLSDRALSLGGCRKLYVCLSSRHYPHISVGRGLSLVVEDEPEHIQDIETYVAKRLTCSDGPEKDDLRIEIRKKSACIFLWVVLVVEILNKLDDHGASLSEMKARLGTIPAGLNELFREILIKSDHGLETCIAFFQWTLFGMRPLEPAELFIAIELSRSPSRPSRTFSAQIIVPPPDRLARYIISCSRGLAEIAEGTPGQPEVVQFIHETVREFLKGDTGLSSIIPLLATNLVGLSHVILRIACDRCILAHKIPQKYKHYCEASHQNKTNLEIFKSEMRLQFPFLEYAITHLFDHAEQAQKYDVSQLTFLEGQKNEHGFWLDQYRLWWNVLERYKNKKIAADETLLHFTTEQRYLNLSLLLVGTSNSIDACCGRVGSVLRQASSLNFIEVVRALIEKGVDVNAHRTIRDNALQGAARKGYNEVVQLLLDAGAHSMFAALYTASQHGQKKLVRVLLDAGAKVNSCGGDAALYVASQFCHEEVVRLLIDAGVNVKAKGSAVLLAALESRRSGQERVVRTLINAGADVHGQGGRCYAALQSAFGEEKVAQMLVDAAQHRS